MITKGVVLWKTSCRIVALDAMIIVLIRMLGDRRIWTRDNRRSTKNYIVSFLRVRDRDSYDSVSEKRFPQYRKYHAWTMVWFLQKRFWDRLTWDYTFMIPKNAYGIFERSNSIRFDRRFNPRDTIEKKRGRRKKVIWRTNPSWRTGDRQPHSDHEEPKPFGRTKRDRWSSIIIYLNLSVNLPLII